MGAAGVKVCRGSRRNRQVSRPVWDRPKGHRGIDYTATGKFGLDCDRGMTPLTCPDQYKAQLSKSECNTKLMFDVTSINQRNIQHIILNLLLKVFFCSTFLANVKISLNLKMYPISSLVNGMGQLKQPKRSWSALPLYHLCWNINVILKLSLRLQIFCVGLQILDIVPWLFYILGNRFPSTVPLVCLFLRPCIIYSWTAMSQKRTDMKHKKGEKLWINQSKGR